MTEQAALKHSLDQLNAEQTTAFESGAAIAELVSGRAAAIDDILEAGWRLTVATETNLALVAVGGYGRGELLPGSDIDLMVLARAEPDDEDRSRMERFSRLLWDIGLEPGLSMRTLADCAELVRTEITVATNLMESRRLAGDAGLFQELEALMAPAQVWSGSSFFAAKFEEQVMRHQRYGGTTNNLEPNIKEGPGGLRDIQMIAWVARRHFGVGELKALADAGFLTPSECAILLEARRFLWRVRFALHLAAGRREDRLLFEHQRALAQTFGFKDGDNLAVEQFMQGVFRTLIQVERLNERLLQLFEQEILGRDGSGDSYSINRHFRCRGGFLEIVDESLPEREPEVLLEIFVYLALNPEIKGVRAATIRLIRHSLHLIDDNFRNNPQTNALFLKLLREGKAISRELNRMHRYGVLGRFIPPFELVEGRMQFDLFHVYTVDHHSLRVVEFMTEYADPERAKNFPLAAEIFRRLGQPELLYLAGFFHDIGKGRGGDHSEIGARDARIICQRLGLDAAAVKLVTWLVRHHLDLSVTAQRSDIRDPDVINRFARRVGNWSRLDYLYLLTIADIRGTSPKLWNRWKARLLQELYEHTRHALRRGLENPLLRADQAFSVQQAAKLLLSMRGCDEPSIDPIWQRFPVDHFVRTSPDVVAWQTEALIHADGGSVIKARSNRRQGANELFVHVPDQRGLFAAIVIALDELRCNVVEARVATTSDGYSLDTIHFLDHEGMELVGEPHLAELERVVARNLKDPSTLAPVQRRVSQQLKNFAHPVQIDFARKSRQGKTLLEIVAPDRPGLLSGIARAFMECDVRLYDAKIATFGNRVEDFFLLQNRAGEPLKAKDRRQLAEKLREHLD